MIGVPSTGSLPVCPATNSMIHVVVFPSTGQGPGASCPLLMHACRPATSHCLDEDQQMIGVPSTTSLPGCPATGSMFFVVVCPINRTGGPRRLPFNNLKLSSQLGKGALTNPCFCPPVSDV